MSRKKDNMCTSFKAFINMFLKNAFLDKLVEIDFQKELISNEQLASSEDESAMSSMRNNIRKNIIDRAILLRKRLCLSFLIIVSACIFAFIIRFIFQNALQDSKYHPKVFGLISIMSFSVATLGRLFWAGQSIKGDTVIEQLDDRIFKILYWIGSFCGTFAFIS